MVIPTSFELLVFQLLFHLSWIYWYKNINPDSSVCLCICSNQTEDCCCCSTWRWRPKTIIILSYQYCSFYLDYWTSMLFYFILSETLLYFWVASWTTLMTMLYFRCTILWWFSFIYLYSINDSCFVLFMLTCVDYCQFKWSKYTGCYSWYQSFGSR